MQRHYKDGGFRPPPQKGLRALQPRHHFLVTAILVLHVDKTGRAAVGTVLAPY